MTRLTWVNTLKGNSADVTACYQFYLELGNEATIERPL